MTNFNLGALTDWAPLSTGEVLDFDLPEIGQRQIQFDLMSSAVVEVRVVAGDNAWLVALGDGYMGVKCVVDRPVGLVVFGDPNADVFIRTRIETQVIPESTDPSFTTIEPRPAGPSDEVRQMMHIVRINQARREQALMEEMHALREELLERAPASAPAPASDVTEASADV